MSCDLDAGLCILSVDATHIKSGLIICLFISSTQDHNDLGIFCVVPSYLELGCPGKNFILQTLKKLHAWLPLVLSL